MSNVGDAKHGECGRRAARVTLFGASDHGGPDDVGAQSHST
jgi:hypothetical protein